MLAVENLKLVATILVGYTDNFANGSNDGLWKELCEMLRREISNPFVKIVFSLISTSDWKEVLRGSHLPIADNMGIALRYLNDEEVSFFLSLSPALQLFYYVSETVDAHVKNGDLDGLLLSGLSTEKSLELVSNYIEKTSDIQSAVLLLSSSEESVAQLAIEEWVETYAKRFLLIFYRYRTLLDTWKLHYAVWLTITFLTH